MIQEAYVHGVSTRSVDDLVKAMGAGGMSKSQVSRLLRRDRRASEHLPLPASGGVRVYVDGHLSGWTPQTLSSGKGGASSVRR